MMRMRSVMSWWMRASCRIAGRCHQGRVEALVELARPLRVAHALFGRREPDALQLLEVGLVRHLAHLLARGELHDHSHVVEALEGLEVEGVDAPPVARGDLYVALALELVEGLAHRGARDARARRHLRLGEAVAGQEPEVEDVALQPLVDDGGEVAACDELHGVFPPSAR